MIKSVKYICRKYIIIFIKRDKEDNFGNKTVNYGPIKDFTSDLTITDEKNNQYNLIGSICKSGNQSGGHWWYHHKVNKKWYEYNDSALTPDSPPDHNSIIYMLFRLNGEEYKIPRYININEISNHVLNQVLKYNNTEIVEKNIKIKEYIKILVYYVNKINKGKNISIVDINSIKQLFIQKIQSLI